MKLSEVKEVLPKLKGIDFLLPNGSKVPAHFHLTEIGNINKQFMDCGGVVRNETKVSFQLWTSIDMHHRLKAEKFEHIIKLAEEKINLQDAEIEVEYQGDTIEKFGLDFNGENFVLTSQKTACLAEENCGIPVQKVKTKLAEIGATGESCCGPGCC